MIYGCDTKQDIVSMFALHKVLSLCPPDCLTFGSLDQLLKQQATFKSFSNGRTRSLPPPLDEEW